MKTPLATEVDLGPGHIVLDEVPALPERGTAAPPLFGPCLLWPRSPISATAEFLLHIYLLFCYMSIILHYSVSQKKGATLSMAITLSILHRFAKFFHCCKEQ